jgi:hypothetical protein
MLSRSYQLVYSVNVFSEEFKDTKWVIRIRKSKIRIIKFCFFHFFIFFLFFILFLKCDLAKQQLVNTTRVKYFELCP